MQKIYIRKSESGYGICTERTTQCDRQWRATVAGTAARRVMVVAAMLAGCAVGVLFPCGVSTAERKAHLGGSRLSWDGSDRGAAFQWTKLISARDTFLTTLETWASSIPPVKHMLLYHPGTRKLVPGWIGPFRVIDCIGRAAYRLASTGTMQRIHPMLHVSKRAL